VWRGGLGEPIGCRPFRLSVPHELRHASVSTPPSSPGEFRPEALTDPCMTVSSHTARAIHGRLPPSAGIIEFLRLPVDSLRSRHRLPAPFAPRELPRFFTTMEQSELGRRLGTFGLAGLPLVPFPLSSPTKFSSSVRKPRLESRPLYTGHRMDSR
jgi:hypothetical protein